MNTVKLNHTKIDVKMLKEKCPLPDLLRRIGLGKHAKPSCPSPFRSDSKPSWGIFQRDGTVILHAVEIMTLLLTPLGLAVRGMSRDLPLFYRH